MEHIGSVTDVPLVYRTLDTKIVLIGQQLLIPEQFTVKARAFIGPYVCLSVCILTAAIRGSHLYLSQCDQMQNCECGYDNYL